MFVSTYRSAADTPTGGPVGTAMIGLYAHDPPSRSLFHRLAFDEVWHFYGGDPIRLVLLHPDGTDATSCWAPTSLAGQLVQYVIPAGTWQAGELRARRRRGRCSAARWHPASPAPASSPPPAPTYSPSPRTGRRHRPPRRARRPRHHDARRLRHSIAILGRSPHPGAVRFVVRPDTRQVLGEHDIAVELAARLVGKDLLVGVTPREDGSTPVVARRLRVRVDRPAAP